MTDIEKLIERLRNNNIENNCHDCALGYYAFEAAFALSTLQAENEKLRAELEQVKAERDAAVKCIEKIEDALNFQRMSAIGLRISEWRGQKED